MFDQSPAPTEANGLAVATEDRSAAMAEIARRIGDLAVSIAAAERCLRHQTRQEECPGAAPSGNWGTMGCGGQALCAIRVIGRVVTPGVLMSNSTKLMPRCLGASGSVRTRQKIQSALSA